MAKIRPIIREPRTTVETREAAGLFIHERMKPEGVSAHPGQLFTTESAGTQVKAPLGGGAFNPVSNKKYK